MRKKFFLRCDIKHGFQWRVLEKNEQKNASNAVFPSHKNFIETIFHFSNNLKPELKKSWTADIILCGMPPSEMGGVLGKNLKSIGEGQKFWFLGELFYRRGGKEFVGKMQNCIITIWYHFYNLKREKHPWRSSTLSRVAG